MNSELREDTNFFPDQFDQLQHDETGRMLALDVDVPLLPRLSRHGPKPDSPTVYVGVLVYGHGGLYIRLISVYTDQCDPHRTVTLAHLNTG